jgi:hypothetical protein
MSAASDGYDSAVADSFFATVKKELVHGCAFETRPEARTTRSATTSRTQYNARGPPFRRRSSRINSEPAYSIQLAA